MKEKIILSVLVLLLVMTCCAALAEGNQTITFDMPTVRQTYDADELDDSDELASEFISRILRSGKRGMLKAGAKRGTNLSGPAANIYPLLYADVRGQRGQIFHSDGLPGGRYIRNAGIYSR